MTVSDANSVPCALLVGNNDSARELAEELRQGMLVTEVFDDAPAEIDSKVQEQIRSGNAPTLVVIALPVEKAVGAARICRRQLPSAELMFVVHPDEAQRLRQRSFHTPLGKYRILPKSDTAAIVAAVNQQARVHKQRRNFHTTIDRINVQLSSASDPGEVRKLLISDRYRASLISNAVDAIISVDRDRRITAWNPSAERLFRVPNVEGEILSKLPLGPCASAFCDAIEDVFSGKTLPVREIEYALPDNTPVAIEATFARVLDDDGIVIGASIIARDITKAKRAEHLLRLEHNITRQLVEPGALHERIGSILSAIARETGASVAEFWSVAESDQVILAEVIWSDPSPELALFTERSRQLRLRPGEGLPGRVWQNSSRVTECDPATDPNFVRRDAAIAAGLRSGLAFPIATRGQFLGAVNLFGKQQLKTDAALFEMVGAVATDLAQWIHRRRAEEALEASERELRALANSIPQLAWIANADGYIVWYNQRWFDYTGATPARMEGWGWQAVHDPKVLPDVMTRWKDSISRGTPFEMEFPLRAADGSFRWFLTRVNPVRDKDHRIVRWFGTNTDVDEVRRSREALQEETRMLEILDSTGKAIASDLNLEKIVQTVTDSATALTGAKFGAFFYTTVNQQGEALVLFTLSGAPRHAFEKFGHPRATPLFGPTFKGEAPIRCEDVTKDPRYGKMAPHFGMPAGHLPVRSYLAVPVISRSRDIIGGLFFGHPEPGMFNARTEKLVVGMAAQAAIAIDNAKLFENAQSELVQRRQVESELRRAQAELQKHASTLEDQVNQRTAQLRETIQELEAFSYSVSHDMRAPLRAMQGYSDALIEEFKDSIPATGQEYLRRIRRAATRLDLLIQDVLAYSKVAKGEIVLQPVDFEHVLHDVIQHYPQLQPDRAQIRVQGPIPLVLGHEAYITQIVSNLLGNAVKFIAPGIFPAVDVSASSSGDTVRISFRDNGIGIDENQQKHIFQIFGRVYGDKKYEGTGIGLAIVKKAAERMGGSVGVISKPGSGSEFYVVLKRAI